MYYTQIAQNTIHVTVLILDEYNNNITYRYDWISGVDEILTHLLLVQFEVSIIVLAII